MNECTEYVLILYINFKLSNHNAQFVPGEHKITYNYMALPHQFASLHLF